MWEGIFLGRKARGWVLLRTRLGSSPGTMGGGADGTGWLETHMMSGPRLGWRSVGGDRQAQNVRARGRRGVRRWHRGWRRGRSEHFEDRPGGEAGTGRGSCGRKPWGEGPGAVGARRDTGPSPGSAPACPPGKWKLCRAGGHDHPSRARSTGTARASLGPPPVLPGVLGSRAPRDPHRGRPLQRPHAGRGTWPPALLLGTPAHSSG